MFFIARGGGKGAFTQKGKGKKKKWGEVVWRRKKKKRPHAEKKKSFPNIGAKIQLNINSGLRGVEKSNS